MHISSPRQTPMRVSQSICSRRMQSLKHATLSSAAAVWCSKRRGLSRYARHHPQTLNIMSGHENWRSPIGFLSVQCSRHKSSIHVALRWFAYLSFWGRLRPRSHSEIQHGLHMACCAGRSIMFMSMFVQLRTPSALGCGSGSVNLALTCSV